ncbi:MAG: Single-stranded-DNA-specific exonuclease RecJ [Phycisphaerae bacterium]|nr:Single-stranded-DNA-specific exonuclease RecJ [Phycisphaerae bacterium]
MNTPKRWIVTPPPPAADSGAVAPLVATLLAARGLSDPADAESFLDPKLADLPEPELLPGAADAAKLILSAVRENRRIVLYGDYDVDGITGVAILWHAIRLAARTGGRDRDGNVGYYVPHRVEEGYGLNAEALAGLARDGASQVVTVDCGITAIDEAQVARKLGIELIITDHHEPAAGGALPDAAAIVHPRLPGSVYPNGDLCGSGVAFKLAWAIGQQLSPNTRVTPEFRQFLMQAVTLAALGTVADVVPLLGENRIITAFGLRSIKKTQLAGLDALIDSANLRDEKVDSYHVGFSLAPRLNAAGRMDAAHQAVELFTAADAARAREIADYLETHNRQRQATERSILHEAIQKLGGGDELGEDRYSIVLADEGWHPGVIGIVASRLVDRYNRPTVLIGSGNGVCQGSGRSLKSGAGRFNMHDALEACGHLLVSHGGHAMAGGVKVEPDKVAAFAEAFEAYARRCLTPDDLTPVLRIDALATSADLDLAVIRQVRALAPFGMGNPHPVLACEGCRLSGQPRRVGRDGAHLQLHVALGDRIFKAIAFKGAAWEQPLRSARAFDVAFEPVINEWAGRVTVEMQIRDLRFK